MQAVAWQLMSEDDYDTYLAEGVQETLQDKYEIYQECMDGTGEVVKTFDEWLNT